VIDHHVDRPDVEVQRCMKLTGPNRPTGSRSAHHPQHASVQDKHPRRTQPWKATRRTKHVAQAHATKACATHQNPSPIQGLFAVPAGWAGRPGGFGGGTAPDPIPNSAVKTPSAHGTVSQGTGE
jgi:hypothetical protein